MSNMDDVFKQRLAWVLNSHSIDNEIGIPDYILADHICEYLRSIQRMTSELHRHMGVKFSRETTVIQ